MAISVIRVLFLAQHDESRNKKENKYDTTIDALRER
jgi:hypothetical protein